MGMPWHFVSPAQIHNWTRNDIYLKNWEPVAIGNKNARKTEKWKEVIFPAKSSFQNHSKGLKIRQINEKSA